MYEQLSKSVERVIKVAQEIAREYDQDYIGTEHVLLAITREDTGRANAVLQALKVNEFNVKAAVDRKLKKSMEDTWVFGRLPGTPHFKNAMATAIAEAQRRRSREVCNEHLLLAMSVEKGCMAEAVLEELGATPQKLRDELDRLTAAPPGPAAAPNNPLN